MTPRTRTSLEHHCWLNPKHQPQLLPNAMLRWEPMARPWALPVLLLCLLAAPLGCSGSAPASPQTLADQEPSSPASNAPESSPASNAPESSPASNAPESGAEPPQSGEYGGTYFVPVPPELDAYAHFELSDIRIQRDSEQLRLSYELPELLLGERQRVSFRGVLQDDGTYLLGGDDGTAHCQSLAAGLRCEEALRVEPDGQKLDQLLESLPAPEASARRAIADRFAIDPIGVLNVDVER